MCFHQRIHGIVAILFILLALNYSRADNSDLDVLKPVLI